MVLGTVVICGAHTRNTDPKQLRLRLLVIEGEVTLENLTAARDMLQTGTVLGPSRLMGKKIFLIDGLARAGALFRFYAAALRCTFLSGGALQALNKDHPRLPPPPPLSPPNRCLPYRFAWSSACVTPLKNSGSTASSPTPRSNRCTMS